MYLRRAFRKSARKAQEPILPMPQPQFDVIFARSAEDLRAAQALRYEVFVEELGGDGTMVDHARRLEIDAFDAHSSHLLLLDRARAGGVERQVVGAYRLLDENGAARAGGFYSAREYDLSALLSSKRKLLELGRSCLHKDYRGGSAMHHLWTALGGYIAAQKTQVLFGVASFHGTDMSRLAAPLSLLHHRHLAPVDLRPIAKPPFAEMDQIAPEMLDRKAAMVQVPSLIKAYLRLGGCVGQGAYLDHSFNTTDVCLVLDVAQMSEKQRRIYTQGRTR